MNSNKCMEHQMTKLYLKGSVGHSGYRLQCWKCSYQQNIYTDWLGYYTMLANRAEDKQMFEVVVDQCIAQCHDSQQFKQIIKQKLIKQINIKKQSVKIMADVMISDSEQAINQWMDTMISRMDGQQYHDINQIKASVMDHIKIQNEYKDKLKQMKGRITELNAEVHDLKGVIRRQEQEIKEYKQQIDLQNVSNSSIQSNLVDSSINIKTVKKLKNCENMIYIGNYDWLNDYKRQIKQYQRDKKQYRIQMDFNLNISQISPFHSIDRKMQVIGMIDRLNANENVGEVEVGLDNDYSKWNDEIMKNMISRYNNVYRIKVDDNNDKVDDRMHGFLKQWVSQQPVIEFGLRFQWGSLSSSDDGLGLMKEYNRVMKQKQYLDRLEYKHKAIGGIKDAEWSWTIRKLIAKVDKS